MKAFSSTISSDLSYQPQRIRVVAAEIEKNGQILITQRREKAVYPLYWEFPSGKVDCNESDEDALRREVEERLGIHIQVSESLSSAPKWTHRLTYHGYNPHHGDSKLTIIK